MIKPYISKQKVGLILGIIVAIIIWNVGISNISSNGQKAMALSMMTVIFWATSVTNVGYISILYLISLVLFNIAKAADVFSLWFSPTIYLIIGAYLISDAVNRSGLGERIAYLIILKYVHSSRSIIISIFCLQIILSLLIPHPWPRAFLILSVMQVIIKSAEITKEDAANIGFSVFAAAVPTSMLFLTGDSTINTMAVSFMNKSIGWMDWLYYMGIPALIASILTCILLLSVFKLNSTMALNKAKIRQSLTKLGKLTAQEKKVIFWMSVAIGLWVTDSIHNIDLGWITIMIAVLMSMPIMGNILDGSSWKAVPINTLFFLNAALTIGKIGQITDMNSWIVSFILPSTVPNNIFIFGLLISVVSIGLHMVLGSVLAVMGIAIPAFLAYTSSSALNPIVPILLVYTSVAFHYILPYQHITILVGMGEEHGMYGNSHAIKMGVPLTLVVFITVLLVQIPWWYVIGLL